MTFPQSLITAAFIGKKPLEEMAVLGRRISYHCSLYVSKINYGRFVFILHHHDRVENVKLLVMAQATNLTN